MAKTNDQAECLAEQLTLAEQEAQHAEADALQQRIVALGYTPGETPAGVLPWLVDFAEDARREVASMQRFMELLDSPVAYSDDSDPEVTHFRSALINYVVTCFACQLIATTPEEAPNCVSVILSPSSKDHDLAGYRMLIAVARPAKLLPDEQRDEAWRSLDEIRNALGNGADEMLWPPGKTLSEAVKRLATMPSEVRALAKHYDRDGDFWSCLRCGGMWSRDIVTACANCHQSRSAEGVLIQAGADAEGPRPEGCDCASPSPFPGAPGPATRR